MSFRKAINDKCRECIYDPHQPGTWRQQVEACTGTSCPLYVVRPKSTGDRGNTAGKAGKNAQESTNPEVTHARG